MASLAERPELVGFFSYSRQDDEDSHGALSALRDRIQRQLRGQLGRSREALKLWQDTDAIPWGALWEARIKEAIDQSVFFIPIITPTVIHSRHCRFELEAFLEREAALDRSDLVFPILYIRVPALEDEARRNADRVLSIVAKRQYLDWQEFRFDNVDSPDIARRIDRFCRSICDALYQPWLSPDERSRLEKAAAQERAEAERVRQEAEAKRRAEEERKQAAAIALVRAEEEKRRRAAEAERQRAAGLVQSGKSEVSRGDVPVPSVQQTRDLVSEAQGIKARRIRSELEAKSGEVDPVKEQHLEQVAEVSAAWPPSRRSLFLGLLVIAFLGGIAVWASGMLSVLIPLGIGTAPTMYDGVLYDGVYQGERSVVRFYRDGIALLGEKSARDAISLWGDYTAKGTFILTSNRLKLSMTSAAGTVVYDGVFSKGQLSLSSSNNNGTVTFSDTCTFVSWLHQ
jgi:TIR domain-containing protein